MLLNKVVNRFNRYMNAIKFIIFENKIKNMTWNRHEEILSWAEAMSNYSEIEIEKLLSSSVEPLVKKGYALRKKVLLEFKDKYSDNKTRVLIHIPSKINSPGGYSLFNNLLQSLSYIGIVVDSVIVGEDIKEKFNIFKPTVFISSDNKGYLSAIDWKYVKEYKKNNELKIGLTASIEAYGNTSLISRLKWAKDVGIDFYYSFRSQEYLKERIDYKPFLNEGYKIITVEFGANPLIYFPMANIKKDIDFVFLASSNADKQKRYFEWLPNILNNHSGFIDGPGWHKILRWASQPTHKYIYARAKIGLNLHIDDSIDWASELNERTYILAACGTPQLIDNAKLLPKRFSSEAMFRGETPEEYSRMFEYMFENPLECERRALIALEEVFEKHTTLHRADGFILKIKEL